MSKQSRLYGLIIMLVLAVAGGSVAALLLATSSKAGTVELTSADYVPGDADLYVALNSDLTSSQWITALSLVKKLSGTDPLPQAKSQAGSGGFDWSTDVAPFLGGDAGIFVRHLSTSISDVSAGVIIRCKDSGKALATLQSKSGLSFSQKTHNGQTYLAADDGSVYVARSGEQLLGANNEQTLFDAFDAKAGKSGGALSSQSSFKALRDELAGNFLAFVYVSPSSITSDLAKSDDFIRSLAGIPAGSSPLAFELGAKSKSFELQGALTRSSGDVPLPLQQHRSRFASMVPADTSVFVSTNGGAQAWQKFVNEKRQQLDGAVAQGSEYSSLDQALKAQGKQLGIKSLQDLVGLLTGETALAVRMNGGSPSAVLLAEVSDPSQASAMLDSIARSRSGGSVTTEQVGKVTLHVFSDDTAGQLAYAVTDGYVAAGSYDDVKAVIGQPSAVLADRPGYKATVAETPVGLASYAYVDVAGLVQVLAGSYAGDVPGIAAVQGLIINAVESNNIVRVSGVLAVGN